MSSLGEFKIFCLVKSSLVVRPLESKCLTHSSFGEAYGNDGAQGRSSHSKSPALPAYTGASYNSYDGHNQSRGMFRAEGWDAEKRGADIQSSRKADYPTFPQTLEELELEYKREAMDLGRNRDKEEDDENYKHREAVREMRENYMKRLSALRAMHARQWEEFLQLEAQRRQQRARQQMPPAGFGGYKQNNYSDFDNSAGNPMYAGGNMAMDSRVRYPDVENYPSRPHESYGDFQRQRHEDYGKAYNRY